MSFLLLTNAINNKEDFNSKMFTVLMILLSDYVIITFDIVERKQMDMFGFVS